MASLSTLTRALSHRNAKIFFGGSILILFVLPWLDTSKVRSGSFRPMFRWFYWLVVINFIALAYLGAAPAEGGATTTEQPAAQ